MYLYLRHPRDFPGSLVVKTLLPMQEAWVLALVRELRSFMPHDVAKKKKKTSYYEPYMLYMTLPFFNLLKTYQLEI